jgi:hypothetical protein
MVLPLAGWCRWPMFNLLLHELLLLPRRFFLPRPALLGNMGAVLVLVVTDVI